MRIKYIINCPHQLLSPIVGSIPLNGKLLYWASLTAFPNAPSNQNAWHRAKRLCNRFIHGKLSQAKATRLFTFITFNKVYNMQGLCSYSINLFQNFYICYDLSSNTYHNFAIYINRNRKKYCLNLVKKATAPIGNQNYFYTAFYDPNIQTVYIEDPPHDDISKMEISQVISGYKKRLIEDFLKLKYSECEINNEKYLIADLGDGYEIGISKAFLTEPDSWFEIKQNEYFNPIMKNIYCKIDDEIINK